MISKSPKEKVPLTKENLTKFNLILDDLFKLPCASDFIHPVNFRGKYFTVNKAKV